MGGSAFSSEGLLTPRMPPSVYYPLRDSLQEILQKSFYAHVQTPIEAPEKPDHGDIDIKVCSPLKSFTSRDIAEVIGAKHFKRIGSNEHFAIPWPKSDEASSDHNVNISKETFIQVDVELIPNPAEHDWAVFQHSHGDLWNILGVFIREYGLTASNSGIYVRIEEIEPHNKTAARVLLTADRRAALNFLGLDYDRYWAPFKTKRELFEYVGTCRFYDPTRIEDLEDLKSKDRRRTRKRSMFSEWIDEYLPQNRDRKKGEWAHKTRDEIVEISTQWFDVGEEFEQRKNGWIQRIEGERLWTDIRTALPLEGTRKGIAMKGLKREIASLGEEQDLEEACLDLEVRKWFKEGDYTAVKAWAMAHWGEVEMRQTQSEKVACAKYFQAQAAKAVDLVVDEMIRSCIATDAGGDD